MVLISDRTHHELKNIRDTVESIWIAIVMALVLRAFIIEAFVIPTGSMAPELMGEHWDLVCPACGYEFAYGVPAAQLESRSASARRGSTQADAPQGAYCPNCRRPIRAARQLSFGGDRVLVLKYLYRFAPPQPFDVVVFRNPQNNRENYIKRLIGLPGETVEIVHGDVFVSDTPDGPRRIRRKPPVAQTAMWQVVYDNDYPPSEEAVHGAAGPRWVAGEDAWTTDVHQRRFVYAGGAGPTTLTFQGEDSIFLPQYGYNSAAELAVIPHSRTNVINPQVDVCTDLCLSVEFMPAEAGATLTLSLSSFDDFFRGVLSADGEATLLYRRADWPADRWDTWGRTIRPAMKLGQGYEVALENADLAVRLMVDGKAVLEVTDGYPKDYQTLKYLVANAGATPIPTPQVWLAAGGGRCELRHLRVLRDVYYTTLHLAPVPSGPLGEYARTLGLILRGRRPGWGTIDNPITLARHTDDPDLDEFFVLGDNSPQSLDSRGWTWAAPTLRLFADADRQQPLYRLGTVPRYNLIGKAFFVYWPAGFRPPGLPGLPIVPNFGKMRLVR